MLVWQMFAFGGGDFAEVFLVRCLMHDTTIYMRFVLLQPLSTGILL